MARGRNGFHNFLSFIPDPVELQNDPSAVNELMPIPSINMMNIARLMAAGYTQLYGTAWARLAGSAHHYASTVNGKTIDSLMCRGNKIRSSLRVAAQADGVVKKTSGMLGFIGRGIEYKNHKVMLQFYRTLAKLYLEYCMQL